MLTYSLMTNDIVMLFCHKLFHSFILIDHCDSKVVKATKNPGREILEHYIILICILVFAIQLKSHISVRKTVATLGFLRRKGFLQAMLGLPNHCWKVLGRQVREEVPKVVDSQVTNWKPQ